MARVVDKKVLKIFGREQAYWTAIISLTFFHGALVVMGYAPAFIPLDRRRFVLAELTITLTCVISFTLMWMHATNRLVTISRWSYLVACFAATLAIGVFIWGDTKLFGWTDEAATILLLLTGLFIAASMHIEHGGRRYTIKKKED